MKEKIQLTNGGRGGNDPSVNGNEAPLPPTYHNLREKVQMRSEAEIRAKLDEILTWPASNDYFKGSMDGWGNALYWVLNEGARVRD